MSDQRRTIAKLSLTKSPDYNIEVDLYYELGSRFGTRKRGYYLSVSPIERSTVVHIYDGREYTSNRVAFGLFSGKYALVEEAARFNQKRFDAIEIDQALVDHLVALVLEQSKGALTLGEYVGPEVVYD